MNQVLDSRLTVVGVFENEKNARDAVQALKADGFEEPQIGMVAPAQKDTPVVVDASAKTATVGALTGLGAGALWGLGVVAGVLPGLGPAIAGGALAAIVSSAAVGAGAAGLGGALIGLGIPDKDARYFEDEFKAGKTIVTVAAGSRADTARSILERYRWIEEGAPQVQNPA